LTVRQPKPHPGQSEGPAPQSDRPGAFARVSGHTVHDAPAGTLVMVPPGVPHTFANPGDQPVVMVNIFTPDLYVQYFRDLHDMIADGRQTMPQAAAQVMSRYSTTAATDFA
jgi:oxalate decarboxylase/phosphoglucose isomerase-like protein (cupin superfamily)